MRGTKTTIHLLFRFLQLFVHLLFILLTLLFSIHLGSREFA